MSDAVVKRTVRIAGHTTSVSIEEPFWTALKDIARDRGMSLGRLVASIDADRTTGNLSSAIRLAVLAHYRAAAEKACERTPDQGASG
ncbi:ribbon-helix-helix domain-containing protein [Alsobacter sp. R-9]